MSRRRKPNGHDAQRAADCARALHAKIAPPKTPRPAWMDEPALLPKRPPGARP